MILFRCRFFHLTGNVVSHYGCPVSKLRAFHGLMLLQVLTASTGQRTRNFYLYNIRFMGPLSSNALMRITTQGSRHLLQLTRFCLCPRTFTCACIIKRIANRSRICIRHTIFSFKGRFHSTRQMFSSLVVSNNERSNSGTISMMFTRKDVRFVLIRRLSFHGTFAKDSLLSQDRLSGARLTNSKDFRRRITRPFTNTFVLLPFPFTIIPSRIFTSSNSNEIVARTFPLGVNVFRFVIMFILKGFRLHLTLSTRTMLLLIGNGALTRTIRIVVNLRNLLLRIRTFLLRFGFFFTMNSGLLFPIITLIFSATRRIKIFRSRSNVSLPRRTPLLSCSTFRTSNFAYVSLSNGSKLGRSLRVCVFRGFTILSFNCLCIILLSARFTKARQGNSCVGRRNGRNGTSHRVMTMASMPKFLFGFCVRGTVFCVLFFCFSSAPFEDASRWKFQILLGLCQEFDGSSPRF